MKAFTAFLLILAAALPGVAAETGDCPLAPGWERTAPPRTFGPENLFEYLDGGAEGYLIFGFVGLQHQVCAKGEDSLALDISEMDDAEAAYGLFAARRDPRQPIQPIGMGGEILPARASFAKGKYYVEMTAAPGDDYRPLLHAFVAALEKRTPGSSSPPQELSWFPLEDLKSIRLIPRSVLGLGALKRGYVADYPKGQAFLVTESSADSAAAVLGTLRRRFAGAQSVEVGDEAFRSDDKYLGRVCIFRQGRYLGGYAHLREGSDGAAAARTLASRLPSATRANP